MSMAGISALGSKAMRRYPAAATTEKLAVGAAISEPVSAGDFPVKRENTGNFC
jgi:carbamoylphosphate synthase large subunit